MYAHCRFSILQVAACLVVLLAAAPVLGQNWIKIATQSQGYNLSIEMYRNPGNTGTHTVTTPLYIFSDGKKQGKARGLLGTSCSSNEWWEVSNGYCYSCPNGDFNENSLVGTFGWNKCVKPYKTARSWDSIYTTSFLDKLVKDGFLTARQSDCIASGKECYIGIIGTTGGERYGFHCGGGFGGGAKTMDNVDKCCWAHDNHKWKNNLGTNEMEEKEKNSDCADSMNFLRCLWKAKDEAGYGGYSKEAAERMINALSPVTDPFCGADWKYEGDTDGRWPWSIEGGYTHQFEDQKWIDDPNRKRGQ